jgi:hypothetical protein
VGVLEGGVPVGVPNVLGLGLGHDACGGTETGRIGFVRSITAKVEKQLEDL